MMHSTQSGVLLARGTLVRTSPHGEGGVYYDHLGDAPPAPAARTRVSPHGEGSDVILGRRIIMQRGLCPWWDQLRASRRRMPGDNHPDDRQKSESVGDGSLAPVSLAGDQDLCQQHPPQEGFPGNIYGAPQPKYPQGMSLLGPWDNPDMRPPPQHPWLDGKGWINPHQGPSPRRRGCWRQRGNPPGLSDTSPGAAFIPARKLITPKQCFNDSRQ